MYRKTVSAIMLTLLLTSMLTLAVNIHSVKAEGTIYIRADGSIDPPTANISTIDYITYTFVGNINDSIYVYRSNIIVDGAGCTLDGMLYLDNVSNVTVKRTNVSPVTHRYAQYGIVLYESSHNTIMENNITDNLEGIVIVSNSDYNVVIGNNISGNAHGLATASGLRIEYQSNYNIICNNSITNNERGVWIPRPGGVATSIQASHTTIFGNEIANNSEGNCLLSLNQNCDIRGNRIANSVIGILLSLSYSSTVLDNNITNISNLGVELYNSSYNNVSGNDISATTGYGIYIDGYSCNNSICMNNIVDGSSGAGVCLWFTGPSNSISRNIIAHNDEGIRIHFSSNNKIFHNNIIDNSLQVSTYDSVNSWDDGYPSGGNYWSNHTDVDLYCGPYQNESGSDGIWDHPYVIDENNQDNYPLVNTWIAFEGQTIYIRADGSIDPPDAPISTVDNVTYILTGNITSEADGIVVERSNIIIDGNGFTLQGSGNGTGIALPETLSSNVTTRNLTIKNFERGICGSNSGGNTLARNNLIDNQYGIQLSWYSSGNILSDNKVGNSTMGICLLFSSSFNNLVYNSLENCTYGIEFESCSGNTLSGNIVGANCGCGIFAYSSSNNTLSSNILMNNAVGVELDHCSSNTLIGNTATNNYDGIRLNDISCNNVLSDNNVTANDDGVRLYSLCNNNTLSRNNVANSTRGIRLWSSCDNNVISGNELSDNSVGIELEACSNNLIFHNSFVNNPTQVHAHESANFWDDGYPSGGNYWSDYVDVDLCRGPCQNETGGDGIWDHPNVINANNTDRYPLVNPWTPTPSAVADGFRFPLDGLWTTLQRFGGYNHDWNGYHLGEDVLSSFEVPVFAPADGIVKHNAKRTGYGYVVIIEHQLMDGTSVCSVLGHLREAGRVPVGATVTKGQIVGYLSSLPEENGGTIHLHFGIRKDSYSTQPDRDGGWRYRGYGPADIMDNWYPPSDFISYYNLQKTLTLPKEKGLTVTVDADNTSYVLGEKVKFVATVTNPTDSTGANITAHNVTLTIDAPPEIELDDSQTYYSLGDLLPGQLKTLSFNATVVRAAANVLTKLFSSGDDCELGTPISGAGNCVFSAVDPGEPTPDWSFAIITDLHIGRYGLESNVSDYAREAVDRILAERFRRNIKFVVVLGDLSDTAQEVEFLKAREILSVLNDNGIPYIPLLGNHDLRTGIIGASSDTFRRLFWTENPTNYNLIRLELQDFYPTDPGDSELQNCYFSYGGTNFLCLDVQPRKIVFGNALPIGTYSEETGSFVRKILDSHVGERFIFFSHIPLTCVVPNMGTFEHDLFDRDVLNTIAFAGHTHRNNVETQFKQVHYQVVETEAVSQLGFDSLGDHIFGFDSVPTHSQNVIRIVQFKNAEVSDYSVELTYLKSFDLLYPSPYIKHTWGSYSEPDKPVILTALATVNHGFENLYQWDFGDGNLGTGLTTSHAYLQEGDYNVTLTVSSRNLITDNVTVETSSEIVYVRDRHVVSGMPPDLQIACVLSGEDLTKTPKNTYELAEITTVATEKVPILECWMNFEPAHADINMSTLIADIDITKRKLMVSMPSWPNEVESDKMLFVPSSGAGSVYICLNATSLEDVRLENADFVIRIGETLNNMTVETTLYDGKEYYLVCGNVTGFGGGEIFHDVAITNVTLSKTIVGQGFALQGNVTIHDQGTFDENINLTLYANTATITVFDNVTLSSWDPAMLTFTWNTTGFAYGNYTISAYAEPVSGETNIANNNFTGGWVVVAGQGDLTGGTPNAYDFAPDGKVDIVDVAIVAKCFGQKVPPAHGNCDVSGPTIGVPDGKIDITDVATVAKQYGQHYTYP